MNAKYAARLGKTIRWLGVVFVVMAITSSVYRHLISTVMNASAVSMAHEIHFLLSKYSETFQSLPADAIAGPDWREVLSEYMNSNQRQDLPIGSLQFENVIGVFCADGSWLADSRALSRRDPALFILHFGDLPEKSFRSEVVVVPLECRQRMIDGGEYVVVEMKDALVCRRSGAIRSIPRFNDSKSLSRFLMENPESAFGVEPDK